MPNPISLKKAQYTDPGVNKFSKTNLYYSTDDYMLFQDPTWLGFKLLFFFDQPDSRLLSKVEDRPNTAYTYLKSIGQNKRADLLSKFVNHLQQMNEKTPWFFQKISGLGDAWKRGFQDDDFKSMLPKDRKIEIDCLESIDLRVSALMDLYRKSCFDWSFRREVVPWNLRTFTVYIYVYEMRNINRTGKPSPSGLLDISRLAGIPDINAPQQEANKRLLGEDPLGNTESPLKQVASKAAELVNGIATNPINGIKNALNPQSNGNESANTINPNINRFLFRFSHCEFLPDESNTHLESISNAIQSEPAQQKISFSYRDVEEVNLYNIYSSDAYVQDRIIELLDQSATDVPPTGLAGLSQNVKATLNKGLFGNLKSGQTPPESYGLQSILNPQYNAILPFASLAADRLERLVSSYAGKLLMGNIYGFSPTNIAGAASNILTGDPTQVLNGVTTIGNALNGSNSLRNKTRDVEEIGNVYKK